MAVQKTNVSLLVTDNRETGVWQCIDTLGVNPVKNNSRKGAKTQRRQERIFYGSYHNKL